MFPFIFPFIRELEIVAGVRSGEIADTSSGCVASCVQLNGEQPESIQG
jgi:hypothetical protein